MMNPGETERREALGVAAIPVDLAGAALLLVAAYGIVAVGTGGAVRVLAGAALGLFLPGYVTVAALFPRRSLAADRSDHPRGFPGLRHRLVFALGASIAVTIVLGLVVGVVTPAFTTSLVLDTLAAYVAVAGVAAVARRLRVPQDERFALPLEAWRTEAAAVGSESLVRRLLAVALICSALVATGTFVLAVAETGGGETYTDFHLVTNGSDGEYVAADYPDDLVEGEAAELAWGVVNAEGVETDYTVVVTIERVVVEDGEARRIESVELDRTGVTVPAGERTVHDHTLRPPLVGENLRFGYYLYRGDAPDRPDAETAYRHLHVWTTVRPAA